MRKGFCMWWLQRPAVRYSLNVVPLFSVFFTSFEIFIYAVFFIVVTVELKININCHLLKYLPICKQKTKAKQQKLTLKKKQTMIIKKIWNEKINMISNRPFLFLLNISNFFCFVENFLEKSGVQNSLVYMYCSNLK